MARRQKSTIELASDLGSRAHDLYGSGDSTQVDAALALLWDVNPDLFNWLLERLTAVKAQRDAHA